MSFLKSVEGERETLENDGGVRRSREYLFGIPETERGRRIAKDFGNGKDKNFLRTLEKRPPGGGYGWRASGETALRVDWTTRGQRMEKTTKCSTGALSLPEMGGRKPG